MKNKHIGILLILFVALAIIFTSCAPKNTNGVPSHTVDNSNNAQNQLSDSPNGNHYENSSASKSQSAERYTVDDIEKAARTAIQTNSVDPLKKYIMPYAKEIVNYAYERGEGASFIADCHCVTVEDFFYENRHTLSLPTTLDYDGKVNFTEEGYVEELGAFKSDISHIYSSHSKSIDIRNVVVIKFECESEDALYHIDFMTVETAEGAFLLCIDS